MIVPDRTVFVHGVDSPTGVTCSHCVSLGDETMNALWNYLPDLRACELEDRLVPSR